MSRGRTKRLRVIVEADGGARGNPGPAGYGAVVREAGTEEILLEIAEPIGVATNNVAEYRGLIAGLRAAADLGAVEVDVRMDSKLVVEQMSGRWQIKHPGLRPLAAEAAALIRRFDTVRFTWVPRDRNRRADALANAAMDGKSAADVDVPGPASASTPARSWAPPAGTPATRLVLVRHGETAFTAQRRYSGRGDVPLSEHGLAQAEALAARLKAIGATAVVSSPLSRCVATAEAIARQMGVDKARVEQDLIECDFGDWEGLTFAEVRARWPELVDQWLASPSVAPPGGESFEAVAQRVRDLLPRLLSEHAGETVVLVSHVAPIKLLLRDALSAGDTFLYRLYLDAGGFSIVDYYQDGAIAVRTINDTSHL
ncbi:MAG TPA: bifunctional RNase H/acid phosphatase [Micromonosporaceae bacterium]|nr:bifunctional RNase H/acid phosphatase [Micromonosporaceae bacterium]